MELPGFVGPSYVSQSFEADQEESVNLYYEKMESPGATTKAALYVTPGVTLLASATQTPGKAHYSMASREFAIVGTRVFEIDSTGAVLTDRGTVVQDSYPATINNNADGELLFTAGTNAYSYQLGTNTHAAIAALAGKARKGSTLDGWGIVLDNITNPTTPTVYLSDLSDLTTWDPTRFIQRSARPDPWVSIHVAPSTRLLWLFGEQTSEAWWNTGSSPIPFQLHPSGLIPYGCAAPFSTADGEGSVFWLSQTGQGVGPVVAVAGFAPQVISTRAVENAISSYTTISDAVGGVYSDRGHTFYLLWFPSEQVTWAYDMTTQSWDKRGTWISEEGRYRVWRPCFPALAFGQHRWLDLETGSLYSSSSDVATDVDSRPLRWLRRAPALVNENQRVTYSSLELAMDVGLGISGTAQGSNPQVMLRMSDDGGRTWGSEHWRSAGKVGEWSHRVRWERLGQGRKRVFEFSGSDPAPTRLTGCFIEAHPSTASSKGQAA